MPKPAYHSRWGQSIVIALLVVGLMIGYYRLRGSAIEPFYLNKIFGAVAVILAGLTMLVGPMLSHKPEWKTLIGFRRPLGLLAFAAALTHATLLLFFLGARFPLAYYQKEWWPVGLGILAFLAWSGLVYISRDSQVMSLGFPRWKFLQNWGGRIGFVLVLLHVTSLKYEGWIQWITKDPKGPAGLVNSPYPPSSLIVFVIMVSIIVFRLFHLVFGPKASK